MLFLLLFIVDQLLIFLTDDPVVDILPHLWHTLHQVLAALELVLDASYELDLAMVKLVSLMIVGDSTVAGAVVVDAAVVADEILLKVIQIGMRLLAAHSLDRSEDGLVLNSCCISCRLIEIGRCFITFLEALI